MRSRSPVSAVLTLTACVFGLYLLSGDLLFALEGAPVDVTADPLPHLRVGAHVRLRGLVELPAGIAERHGAAREFVALAGLPVVVLRDSAPSALGPPSPLEASGRLYRGDRAGAWSGAAEAIAVRRGMEASSIFLLAEGEHPRVPWKDLGLAALLLAVVAIQVSRLLRRRSGRGSAR